LPLADDAASLHALFARSFDWIPMKGFPRGLPVDRCAMTKFVALAPC
jgi:hypothetical protein